MVKAARGITLPVQSTMKLALFAAAIRFVPVIRSVPVRTSRFVPVIRNVPARAIRFAPVIRSVPARVTRFAVVIRSAPARRLAIMGAAAVATRFAPVFPFIDSD
ncbi:MAG: hypothetical protein ACM3NJ_00245 [Methanobacterium sp.]